MKKRLLISVAGLALLLVAGCGTQNTTSAQPSTTPTNNANQTASVNQTTQTSTTPAASTALTKQHIYLTVLPGGKLGSDGKKHDAFSPSDFTMVQGVPVTITIYNFDNMKHSVTSSDLGLNIQATPSKKDGDPGVTTVTFTPSKVGDFKWQCIDPCDLDNGQWSMSHDGYMMGTITVE